MKITTELIKTIFDRTTQYALAKYNEEPYGIEIYDDGTIEIQFDRSCCGSTDYDTHEISAEDLSADFDELIKVRKAEVEKRREKEAEQRAKDKIAKEQRDLQQRKIQYLRLKREFEPKLD
jgi:hypothetical protein